MKSALVTILNEYTEKNEKKIKKSKNWGGGNIVPRRPLWIDSISIAHLKVH